MRCPKTIQGFIIELNLLGTHTNRISLANQPSGHVIDCCSASTSKWTQTPQNCSMVYLQKNKTKTHVTNHSRKHKMGQKKKQSFVILKKYPPALCTLSTKHSSSSTFKIVLSVQRFLQTNRLKTFCLTHLNKPTKKKNYNTKKNLHVSVSRSDRRCAGALNDTPTLPNFDVFFFFSAQKTSFDQFSPSGKI